MLDKLTRELTSRLKTIEEKYGYLSFLIDKRLSNEKLLQLEVMRIISLMPEVVEFLPERLYEDGGTQKCDFWFRTSDLVEHWMEIKMRPTNYRKTGHAKAITKGVDDVIDDVMRLKKINSEYRKYVLFAFYPMYPESYRVFDRKHIPRIAQACGKETISPRIALPVGDALFDVYVVGF